MLYKRFITIIIFVLFILALFTALWFVRNPENEKQPVDLTNKVHIEFYQNAISYWNANLETGPFRENSSTAIRLTWSKPQEVYNHFLMTVTDPRSGWSETGSGEHERVSLDFTGLQPDTKYTFVVRACIDVNCTSWITALEEAQARTPKMIWEISQDNKDLTSHPELENWEALVQLSEIVLQNEDGLTFTSEEKNQLTLERVTRVTTKGTAESVMTLKDKEGKTLFAILTNP